MQLRLCGVDTSRNSTGLYSVTRSETSKANDKVIEGKRSESFDNDVFFDNEAKRTRSIVGKFLSKRSEAVYINELKNRSEVNTFDSLKIYFEAKRTFLY
jgi:hypothetical protein